MLYIKRLEIENVRCFGTKQSVDFLNKKGKIAQWTVILGDNGSGKTTLLKSIVAMLPSPQNFLQKRSHLDTEYDLSIYTQWGKYWSLQRNQQKKNSKLKLTIYETARPFIQSKEGIPYDLLFEKNYNEPDEVYDHFYRPTLTTAVFSPVYCFAYGANRKVSPSSLSGNKLLEANETLFRDDAFLSSSEEFFLQMDYESAKSRRGSEQIDRIKTLLIKVLPKGIQDIRVAKTGPLLREVQVKTPYGWVNINELSLGYKTTIAWLIDFASKMIYYHGHSTNPFAEPTILVIDEIDLHMHPAWQYEIIENLTKLFPKTQFIVTAHSPLIVQTALDANIVLLKRRSDHVEIISDPDTVKTWRVDQILTSDLFGVENTRPKKIQKLLNERSKLLSKIELDEIDNNRLKEIEENLGEIPVYEDKYQRQAYSAIDKIADLLRAKN